jgi:UDP-N-acetylmuramoyl-L-alanyl-D-glutamate--2,6-diaminopimelate ligase
MRLLDFIGLISVLRGSGPVDRDVNGVAWDSRRVQPGNLFVALPGNGRDTQAAVDAAIQRGAVAVLCEGNEVVPHRAARIQTRSVRATMPRIAELFFGQADRRLKLIGVAGGYGASATALLLKALIEAAGFKCGLICSTGCEVGERQLPALRKNCESLDVHELLAQMVRANCGACIMEVSPEAIEQDRVGDISFDAVIFASSGASSSSLIKFCRAQANGPKQCKGIFNLDDDIARALFESRICKQQVSFGFNAAADVRGSNVSLAHRSLGMLVAAGSSEILLRTRLTGRQNAMNLLAACAGAAALAVPFLLMRIALQKIAMPVGAMEPVGDAPEVPVYVDSARGEEELRLALESLREITTGRILLAIGSAAGETYEQRCRLGRTAAALADYTVITSHNPGRENAATIAAQIQCGVQSVARPAHHVQLDRAAAIHDLIEASQPGDAILIAGKGHETHQEFADTIVPFDDREHALAALEFRIAAIHKIIPAPSMVELEPALAAIA